MSRRNTTRTRRGSSNRPASIKWTAEEEEVILNEIGKSPTNVKVALLAAAEQLPARSFYACSSHWYTKMANNPDVVGKVTLGRGVSVKNKMRLKPEQQETHKKAHSIGIWNRILTLLFGMDL